jgi:hypothetical protein
MSMFDWHAAYFQTENPDLKETRGTMATLASYANFNDMTCYPSQRTLARLLGCSTETVRRHVKVNSDAGWIEKIRDGKSGALTNKYLFTIATPHTGEGSTDDGHSQLPTHAMGVKPKQDNILPTPTRGVNGTPHTDEVNSPHGRGGAPHAGVGLTTERTTKTTTQLSSDLEGSELDAPSPTTTKEDTPHTHEGSSPHTNEEGLTLADMEEIVAQHWGGPPAAAAALSGQPTEVKDNRIPWPGDKPLPGRGDPDYDPFASYKDDQTGETLSPVKASA